MELVNVGKALIIGGRRGDDLRSLIEGACAERGLGLVQVSGIGAVEDVELGYYDLARKEYVRRTFSGLWELVSLHGNVTLKDGKPFLHAHVAISGPDFAAHGGHLFDARVGAVAELFLTPYEGTLSRAHDPAIGLHCWDLPGSSSRTAP